MVSLLGDIGVPRSAALICKHIRDSQHPGALMSFHQVIEYLQEQWETSRTQVIKQFSTSWGLPEQTIHRRFKLSQHLNNVYEFLVLPFPSSSTGRQGERMISIAYSLESRESSAC